MKMPTKEELMEMSNNEFRAAVYEVLRGLVERELRLSVTRELRKSVDDVAAAHEAFNEPNVFVPDSETLTMSDVRRRWEDNAYDDGERATSGAFSLDNQDAVDRLEARPEDDDES